MKVIEDAVKEANFWKNKYQEKDLEVQKLNLYKDALKNPNFIHNLNGFENCDDADVN